MKIIVKATGFDLTPGLMTFLEDKVGVLSRMLKRYEKEGEVEVRVEIGKTSRHHHKGAVFRAEANVQLPGKLIRAVAGEEDIHAAIINIKEVLHLEIKRYKDKAVAGRRGAGHK